MLPCILRNLLQLSISPSFEFRIAIHLKRWILEFLSFKTIYVLNQETKNGPDFDSKLICLCCLGSWNLNFQEFLFFFFNHQRISIWNFKILSFLLSHHGCIKKKIYNNNNNNNNNKTYAYIMELTIYLSKIIFFYNWIKILYHLWGLLSNIKNQKA